MEGIGTDLKDTLDCMSNKVKSFNRNEAHDITIKLSRDLSLAADFLRSLHICDRLHAPIPSHNVHSKGDNVGDNGNIVENSDRSRGD